MHNCSKLNLYTRTSNYMSLASLVTRFSPINEQQPEADLMSKRLTKLVSKTSTSRRSCFSALMSFSRRRSQKPRNIEYYNQVWVMRRVHKLFIPIANVISGLLKMVRYINPPISLWHLPKSCGGSYFHTMKVLLTLSIGIWRFWFIHVAFKNPTTYFF